MATMNTNGGKREKKNKPRKMSTRVDFTPMVDMNMLLLCFFMFCTTLSKSQVMDIVMPADDGGEQTTLSAASKSLTLILDGDNKVYYYKGFPDYEDYASLQSTNHEGLRNVLLETNLQSVNKLKDLKTQLRNKQISDEEFTIQTNAIKKSSDAITVMIKPTKNASYKNMVEALDEMQICSISKYTIMDMADADDFLLENLQTKGALTAMADKN